MRKAITGFFRVFAFSFVVSASYAQATGNANGHDYVDLGLPSGTLWATCNIGASTPEESGDLFAWGEVTPKTSFSLSNYELYKSVTTEPDADGFTTTYSGYTKYVMESDASTYGLQGFYDNLSVLEKEDDAASVLWGGLWRMPTRDEIMELRNHCLWDWVTLNNMEGYKVTGQNGNYIFFPAAGFIDRYYTQAGHGGMYWGASLSESPSIYPLALYFSRDVYGWSAAYFVGERYYGYSIRPVYKDSNTPKPESCAIPTISYSNGHLSFSCSTEDAKFVYSITCQDAKSATVTDGVDLSVTYVLSVYATAAGHEKSEVATATLCWIDADPKTEGIENGIAQIRGNAVMVQNSNGTINVSGVKDGTDITVYSSAGTMVGSGKASSASFASIATSLHSGDIAIVKFSDKAVKIVLR